MTMTVRAALIQQSCGQDRDANLNKTEIMARDAAAQGASLIVLQELHLGPYFCQSEDTSFFNLAEPIPGPSTERLGSLARELGAVLVASLFERRTAGLYHNTAVIFERDGSIAGKFRKMHIPDDPGYYEKFYFTPGDLGFHPVETSAGKLGVLVCWDQWFPEGARLMALRGADMLIYPTAIGWTPSEPEDDKARQRDAWQLAQRGHAVCNGLPVLSANRVGFEADPSRATDGLLFWGGSFVCGPQGEMLAEASAQEEQVLVCDVDGARSEEVRRIWPFLRDRRIEAYGGLEHRFLD